MALKFVDEFREPQKAAKLSDQINTLANEITARLGRPVQLMEFCGGHTHAIFRFGIEQLLSEQIELVHGPGCPVCVLPMSRVDDCVALAQRPDVIFTTFGDAMRVPGSSLSLLQAKALGAQIKMVYSPLDALEVARQNPTKEIIFFALGFETTMPSTALTLLQAHREGIKNFSLFCNHITTVPILRSLLDAPKFEIDGFIAPGHVSMVVGESPFAEIASQYQKPMVITGFEPLDILQSILMLLIQLKQGGGKLQNQYARVVRKEGNHPGLAAMSEVFQLRDKFEWRGLGEINNSGVKIKDVYAHFDAERKFPVASIKVADPINCQCGEVLKGQIKPWQCKVFGSQCNPENPLGALMVSSEGACAAYWRFGNLENLLEKQAEYFDLKERSRAGIVSQ